ncbi:MAG: caspase family protein [Planctomycetes bacterium]|nr:caspase family protein [Planctomycetota bacterium]
MAVLKTQCPECDAKIRLTVEGAGEHETECPKCGHSFTAEAEPEAASANAPKKKGEAAPTKKAGTKETTRAGAGTKKAKAARHEEEEDDEDEDDAPKKKKKKKGAGDDGKKQKLVLAGVAAGVLLVGGLGAVVFAMSSNKDRTAQKSDAPADQVAPALVPNKGPGPAPTPSKEPSPKEPNPKGPTGNGTVGPNPKQPDKVVPKKITEDELAKLLPPPPKIKLEGSLVPLPDKPLFKAPAIPPLAQDEDPFVRAKDFKPDGALPELPKLTDRGLRPVLALDSGGHTAFVLKVFFTPDGKRIITVSKDKSVRIWDPATNEPVKTIRFPAGPGDEGSLRAAALSRSGKRLAVGGEPLKDPKKGEIVPGKVPIFIVSPETGALIRRIDAGSHVITSMDFSSDGNRLAVGCANTHLQVFDVTTGQQLGPPGGVRGRGGLELKFNPQPKSNLVASLGPDNIVLLADVLSGRFTNVKVNAGTGAATKLAWSNDGKFLAVGCTNGAIVIHDATGKPVTTLPPVTAEVDGDKGKVRVPVQINELAFLPGDRDLAVIGYHRFAAVIDSGTGKVVQAFKLHPNTVFSMDVSPDGKTVVSCGGYHHEALVWEVNGGKVLHRLAGTGTAVWGVAWAKDGKSIAFGHKTPKAGEDGELEHTFRLDELGLGGPPDPTKYVHTVKSDEGVGLEHGTVGGHTGFVIKTPGRGEQLLVLANPDEKIYSATLLPKGNAIVAGGVGDIYLINPATLKVSSNPFIGHTGNVVCVTPSPDGRYFATGSNDQTIRIWRRDLEEPLLSIFVAGREWVAWTTQGYYACSPQGERLMAWQVNPGPNSATRTPQVHPAERFRKSLYQPALLKYVVPAGDLRVAMALAKKHDKALVETSNVADVLPPEVTLEGFTGDAEVKVEKEALTVRATAKSAKHPITSMRLLVNGRPFQGAAGVRRFDKPEPEATATWEVPLIPGTHTVAVIADTGVSRGMSKPGVAVRSGDPPKPNLYVLAMGVSDYPGPMKLRYCATDAQMLSKAFQEHSKSVFAGIEVKLLTDKQCTTKGMLEGLDWLKSKMTPQDVGIVSFSGHGMRDDFGRFYLVSVDIDPADAERTCLPGDVLKDRLDNMPGRLIAILDACHSGMAGNDGKPPARADALVRDLTAEDSGVIVMCASLGREFAIESPISKAGFYTLGLVEGMSGHGDIDGDGVVYLHELDLYATTRVRQLSMGRQNPTFSRPPSVRPFPIAKIDKPPAP